MAANESAFIETVDYQEGPTGYRKPSREYWRYTFAKAAMQGLIGTPHGHLYKMVIGASVQFADALLAELEKGQTDANA